MDIIQEKDEGNSQGLHLESMNFTKDVASKGAKVFMQHKAYAIHIINDYVEAMICISQ